MNLEEAFLRYYKGTCPDATKGNENIIRILAASMACLATRAMIDMAPPRPATFFIAITGPARTAKSTLLRTLRPVTYTTPISELRGGSPEAIIRDLDERRHSFLIYDEGDQLVKLSHRYMDTLPYLLNQMYYLDPIHMGRTTRKSVYIDSESYFTNVYFAALPGQWKEVEEIFGEGFRRRVLVLHTNRRIPYFKENRIDERAAEYLAMIQRSLRALSDVRVRARVEGLDVLAYRLSKELIPETTKSCIEEYMYKMVVGRILTSCTPVSLELTVDEIVSELYENIRDLGVEALLDVSSM